MHRLGISVLLGAALAVPFATAVSAEPDRARPDVPENERTRGPASNKAAWKRDWNVEIFAEEALGKGLKLEKFSFDSSAVQAAAVAKGAEPIPEPVADPEDPYRYPVPRALLGFSNKMEPSRLVILCHGLNGDALEGTHPDEPRPPTPEKSFLPHVERLLATHDGLAVAALNYRDNFLFPVGLGAHDTVALTLALRQRFPSVEKVYLLGISMGGAVSGTAISESVHVIDGALMDGKPLFDHWVAGEPLAVFIESYMEAKAALPKIADEMEQETGGTPQEKPGEYHRRTVAFNADRLAATGLKTVTVVHSVNDGLTPYNQARTLSTATVQAGVPTQLFTVTTKSADHAGPDYSGTGTIAGAAGFDDPAPVTAPAGVILAGHAADWDYSHPVVRTAFEQLDLLLNGEYDESQSYTEHVVADH